jgi:hypothetical protein
MKKATGKAAKPRGKKGFIIDAEAWASISAVEGLQLTEEMKRERREFDRLGLTAEERRKFIIKKYGQNQ